MNKYKVVTHTIIYVDYKLQQELEEIIKLIRYYFDVRSIRTYTEKHLLKVTLRGVMDTETAIEMIERILCEF